MFGWFKRKKKPETVITLGLSQKLYRTGILKPVLGLYSGSSIRPLEDEKLGVLRNTQSPIDWTSLVDVVITLEDLNRPSIEPVTPVFQGFGSGDSGGGGASDNYGSSVPDPTGYSDPSPSSSGDSGSSYDSSSACDSGGDSGGSA